MTLADAEELGARNVYYTMPMNRNEKAKAAMALVMLHGWVASAQVNPRDIAYGLTAKGRAFVTLGRPMTAEELNAEELFKKALRAR